MKRIVFGLAAVVGVLMTAEVASAHGRRHVCRPCRPCVIAPVRPCKPFPTCHVRYSTFRVVPSCRPVYPLYPPIGFTGGIYTGVPKGGVPVTPGLPPGYSK